MSRAQSRQSVNFLEINALSNSQIVCNHVDYTGYSCVLKPLFDRFQSCLADNLVPMFLSCPRMFSLSTV